METIKKIGIVLNSPVGYSETFIKAHIENLGTHVLYASSFPRLKTINPEKEYGKFNAIKKGYSTFLNQVRAARVSRFLQHNKTDLLLAEYGTTGVQILPLCKKRKIPLAVHFHGYDAYRKDVLEKYKKNYQDLFAYASAIIVVSRDMERQIISLGAPAKKVFYNTYGVDIDQFKASDVLHSKKQILAVGRFVEKKAPYLTLLSFQRVLEKVPDATLVMAGDGPLLDVCKQMISSLGLSDNVLLRGSLSHAEVSSLMQQSRAFVQHSITPYSGDSEGTPNTILEAKASGLPVISTRHGGIKDVVIHNKTGFLVNEGDIDEMSNYMIQVLTDAELATRIGTAARKHIVENYSMEESIANLKAILYKNLPNN